MDPEKHRIKEQFERLKISDQVVIAHKSIKSLSPYKTYYEKLCGKVFVMKTLDDGVHIVRMK